MNRRLALALLAGTTLSACAGGPSGTSVATTSNRISPADAQRVPFRALDAVNALRQGAGLGPLTLDDNLTASAATHSRDMSLQNRPWHFGSDGSSPIDRAREAGFRGRLLGEAISETYESELETIAAWMQEPGPRRVILDPAGQRMGFAFYQERNGKIWWTLTVGTAPGAFAVG
jgi:uncharacterized protein YkwD